MHPAIRKDGVAVITGGAKGIGYALAESLARRGMHLVLLDKDATALDAATTSLRTNHVRFVPIAGDAADDDVITKLYQTAGSLGEVALVVNNAAIMPNAGPWGEDAIWRRLMEVNFFSALAVQRAFVPHLLSQHTRSAIVNVGSKEGITTPPGNAAYSVTKAALRVLTEQLAHELRERVDNKVSAHLLIPGYTFTPLHDPNMTSSTPKPPAMWTAGEVAEFFIHSMARNDFYILCEDNEVTRELDEKRIQWSADDLIKNRPALSRWHVDYRDTFKQYVTAQQQK